MESRFDLPDEVLKLILSNLEETDLRHLLGFNKQLNNIIKSERLLERDHSKITSAQRTASYPINKYNHYLLHKGDIALGLAHHFYETNDQPIFILRSDSEEFLQLRGHKGPIQHIISINPSTIASLGTDFTIRIWDKFSGQQTQIIKLGDFIKLWDKSTGEKRIIFPDAEPLCLLALKNNELACIYKNQAAKVYNIATKAFVRTLFHFEGQIINKCTRSGDHLWIEHQVKESNKPHDCTIWDIKTEKIIDHIALSKIKPKFRCLNSSYLEVIDYCNHMAILKQSQFTYFIDTKNTDGIVGFERSCIHRFLPNGKIVILHIKNESWHVSADYCHAAKKFNIEYSEPHHSKNTLTNTTAIILANGNIVYYNWNTHHSYQWDLSKQSYLPNFKLAEPAHSLVLCRLNTLQNGNIIGWAMGNTITIWDESTGKVILNKQLATINKNTYSTYMYCQILSNDNIYLAWQEKESTSRNMTTTVQIGALLRFSLYGAKPVTQEHTCAENPSVFKHTS